MRRWGARFAFPSPRFARGASRELLRATQAGHMYKARTPKTQIEAKRHDNTSWIAWSVG